MKYKGKIYFNKSYPDGVKLRKLDSRRINKLGWKSTIDLKSGLKTYCDYFKKSCKKYQLNFFYTPY